MAPPRIRPAAVALVLAALAVPLAAAPPAAAHCTHPTYLLFQQLVTTCALNQPLEDALAQASDATGHTLAFVLVKDRGFHPPVVHVKSGGSVVMVYADAEAAEQHDPRDSARCSNTVDPVADPEGCLPGANPGRCFDALTDLGGFLEQFGDTYPLTFRFDGATLRESKGLLSGTLPVVGDPPLAEPFQACAGVSYDSPVQAVVPYHCRIHGVVGAGTMRGTIVVEA